jgi:hypothetical protein
MNDPFESAIGNLFASVLAETFDYEYANRPDIAPGVRVLSSQPDTQTDFGQVSMQRDLRKFEILRGDLPILPARGDRLVRAFDGAVFEVRENPRLDQLGLMWVIEAYSLGSGAAFGGAPS